ncbi:substrate-binding domain-containing protein [Lacticaseibacillus baoqingensis]|uniref:Substrate-binding domain-containing protein n=1 Tax=Lacticaseibacillus baoqingensis TaxID=2486013 RepID=A0ABW4E2W4_9LACO|nr:substrate-binding domain-containing protein [Lacticaseibacillus baoqingensis]
MSKKKLWTTGLIAGFVGLGLALSRLTFAAPPPRITIAGSTAMQPLLKAAAKADPHLAVSLHGQSSTSGLRQVAAQKVTLAASDVFAQQVNGVPANKLVDHPIAVVGIAVITSGDTGVTNVTTAQLQGLFSGQLTNWRQVGGHDLPVTLINRTRASGTRTAFDQLVLGPKAPLAGITVSSAAALRQQVRQTPGAIGYVAFSARQKSDRQLTLNGQAPTAKNVTSNQWPLWTYEHLYSLGAPNAATVALIQSLQSANQQAALSSLGYVPLAQMQVARTADGQIEDTH